MLKNVNFTPVFSSSKSLTYFVHLPIIFFATLFVCYFYHKVFGIIVIQDDLNEILYSAYLTPQTRWWELLGFVKFHYYTPLKHLVNFIIKAVFNTTATVILVSLILNLFIHITNAIFLYFLTLKFSKNSVLAFLTALAFGTDVIHFSVVAGLAARGHLFTCFFALLLCWLYMRYINAAPKLAKILNILIPFVYLTAMLLWNTVMFIPLVALFYYMVVEGKKLTKKIFLKNILPIMAIAAVCVVLNKLALNRVCAGTVIVLPFYELWGWESIYKVPVRLMQYIVGGVPLRIINLENIFFTGSVLSWFLYGALFAGLIYTGRLLYQKQKETLTAFAFFAASAIPFMLYLYPHGASSYRHLYVAGGALAYLFYFAVIACMKRIKNKPLFYALCALIAANIFWPVIYISFLL